MTDRELLISISGELTMIQSQIATQLGTPTGPTGPTGGPPPSNHPYPGPNMWEPGHRMDIPFLKYPQTASGGFTVPPDGVGQTVEVNVSGSSFYAKLDGVIYAGGIPAVLGDHLIEILCYENTEGSGSVDVNHYRSLV